MDNPHILSQGAQAILNEITNYHSSRLHEFDARMARKQRAQNLADSQGVPSIARAIIAMSQGDLRKSAPLEYEMFAKAGDQQRIEIPLSALRDLTVATASAGGFLVSGRETSEALDILRPWSVTARAGAQIETGLVGTNAVPVVSGKSTPAWLSTESTPITPSNPTLVERALVPKNVGAVINFSRQLALQTNAEIFVQRELLRTIGTAIDQAVLNGSGAAGQPTGILNTAGIGAIAGTTLGSPGVIELKRLVAVANAPDEAIAYLSTPDVRAVLEARVWNTGGDRSVWQDDKINGRAGYVSTDMPANSMLCAAFEAVFIGIWGGIQVEINPYESTNFKSGKIQARMILTTDVAVLHPGAFSKATGIT